MERRAGKPSFKEVVQEEVKKQEYLPEGEFRERLLRRAIEVTEQIHDKGFDLVVFMDKSDRPLSWMFRKIWKEKYSDE
ncbi:MAG: hypothetical protein ABH846_02555, partial [Patescibacteria group bacterium]